MNDNFNSISRLKNHIAKMDLEPNAVIGTVKIQDILEGQNHMAKMESDPTIMNGMGDILEGQNHMAKMESDPRIMCGLHNMKSR